MYFFKCTTKGQKSFHITMKTAQFEKKQNSLRPETYPKSFAFKPLDPPKKGLFWGGSVSSDIFFNFGDTTLLQNMKNIKSKFLIDL